MCTRVVHTQLRYSGFGWKLKCSHACVSAVVFYLRSSRAGIAISRGVRHILTRTAAAAVALAMCSHRKCLSMRTCRQPQHTRAQRLCGRPHAVYNTEPGDNSGVWITCVHTLQPSRATQTVHNFRFNIFGTWATGAQARGEFAVSVFSPREAHELERVHVCVCVCIVFVCIRFKCD